MKQVIVLAIVLAIALVATIIFQVKNHSQAEESMIYFPIHETMTFESANTAVNILGPTSNGRYSILWRVHSILKERVYLRQDISLLFFNGRLRDLQGEWKQKAKEISMQKKIVAKETAIIKVISFHHGEIHEANERITSTQWMSSDHVYVINNKYDPFQSFSVPKTKTAREWKHLLDNAVNAQDEQLLRKSAKLFSLATKDYEIMPLTEISVLNEEPLRGFSMEQTEKIVGELWEGLYKNYFLRIKKADGTIISPINSTIPLLLIAKDQTHLLIIFEDATGEVILLRQSL